MSAELICAIVVYGMICLTIGVSRPIMCCDDIREAYTWLRSNIWDYVSVIAKIFIVLLNILFFPGLILSWITTALLELVGVE